MIFGFVLTSSSTLAGLEAKDLSIFSSAVFD
jgi:hypothetical protein